MKKAIAIILATLMLLSFSACNSNSGKPSQNAKKTYSVEKDGITYTLSIGTQNELLVSTVVEDKYTGIGDYKATKVYLATLSDVTDTGATITSLSFKEIKYDDDFEHPISTDRVTPETNRIKGLQATFDGPVSVTFSGTEMLVADDKIASLDPTASVWSSVDVIDTTFELRDYSEIPDILTAVNGSEITTSKQWGTNREALIKIFEDEIFGPIPKDGFTVNFEQTGEEDAFGAKATKRTVKMTITTEKGSLDATLKLWLPKNAEKAVPVILGIGGESFAEQTTSAGYALASIDSAEFSPDNSESWNTKIISLFDEPQFRTLSAWAFGLMRAVDYFETIPDEIDNDKIIARGMSRTGKAANWAAVNDLRIDAVISCQSGTAGDQIVKNTTGEKVKEIVGSEGNAGMPYWMCDNFKKYVDNEDALPIDFHQLVALIAPRPYYQVAAYYDNTSGDPFGQYNTFMIANKVWALYGYETPEYTEQPPEFYEMCNGDVTGFHIKYSVHSETAKDIDMYLKFFKDVIGW